jgi:putative membrane protein
MMTMVTPSTSVLTLALALVLPPGLALAAESKPESSKAQSEGKLSGDDSNFIKEAAQGGMLEVQLGKLAQEKASNEKVKEFGKRMEQDHSKANNQLKKIASDKKVQLSDTLDKKHKSKVDKLSKLSGSEFDRQYMQEMVDDHKADVRKFQRVSDKGKDTGVKRFASETLPTLKEHLQLAEGTAKDVKGSRTSSKSSGAPSGSPKGSEKSGDR